MTDEDGSIDDDNGLTGTDDGEVGVRVVSQFVRDLSFESPNVEILLEGPTENPNLKLEVNVNARRLRSNLFLSEIEFKSNASTTDAVIYDLEVVYGGVFEVENLPQDALEPFLLVNCPALLFPFLRRLIADLTREGGFPPLFLDPIDFAGLYLRRKQEADANASDSGLPN